MDSRIKEFIAQGDYLFSKRLQLMSIWQELTDNFYPEREGFTRDFTPGDEFAEHLMSSFPVMMRRDLGNLISSMLRPSSQHWFSMTTGEDELYEDHAATQWMEYASNLQRKVMYDPASCFVSATKQADHDYITFGQTAMTCELNKYRNGLLHRTWHLRDIAWCDGYDGKPETAHQKWKLPIKHLVDLFGEDKLHEKLKKAYKKEPYREVEGRRIVLPSEEYNADKGVRQPYQSIWIDTENEHILEDVGIRVNPWVIPVWHKANGSQYGHSPATIVALPEARIHQAMTLTLLDAGEMATNPPLIAKNDAFREDFNRFPGGVSFADLAPNEKIGDIMTLLQQDKSGLPFGDKLREDQKTTLMDAFYINKINLPPPSHNMTATESSYRNQEFIRNTLPLFEPIEQNYSAALCEKDFELILSVNGFGPLENIPESLRNRDVKFKFKSPLVEAIDRENASAFMESLDIIERSVQFEPGSADNLNIMAGVRDALKGVKAPAKWVNPEEVVMELIQQRQAAQAEQMRMEQEQASSINDQTRAVADQEIANAAAATA